MTSMANFGDYAKQCKCDPEKVMGRILIKAAEVAKRLNISRRTFESLVKRGDAPVFIWIGHQRRWKDEDVEEFISKKMAESQSFESDQ